MFVVVADISVVMISVFVFSVLAKSLNPCKWYRAAQWCGYLQYSLLTHADYFSFSSVVSEKIVPSELERRQINDTQTCISD